MRGKECLKSVSALGQTGVMPDSDWVTKDTISVLEIRKPQDINLLSWVSYLNIGKKKGAD